MKESNQELIQATEEFRAATEDRAFSYTSQLLKEAAEYSGYSEADLAGLSREALRRITAVDTNWCADWQNTDLGSYDSEEEAIERAHSAQAYEELQAATGSATPEELASPLMVYHNTNATQGVKILEWLAGPLTRIEGMNCWKDSRGNEYVVTRNRIVELSTPEFSEYIPAWERPFILALIEANLKAGNSITVHDGEERTLLQCTDKCEIIKALGTTGEDTITIFNEDSKNQGYFYLIYNNGSKGHAGHADEPEIVLCDYAANDYCEAIVNAVQLATR